MLYRGRASSEFTLSDAPTTDEMEEAITPASFALLDAQSLENGGAPPSGPIFSVNGITYSSYSNQRAFEAWNGTITMAPPQAPPPEVPDNPQGPEPGEI